MGVGPIASGGSGGSVPAASTTVAGKVELATDAEAVAGTDTVRAVTPSGISAAILAAGPSGADIVQYPAGGPWPSRPSADLVIWVSSDRAATTPAGATGDDIVILPSPLVPLMFALSDESTAITTGTAKLTARAPYAFTLSAVRASVNTVSSSGVVTVDINKNGTTVMSTNKLSIDASEKTSVTAATAAGITTSSFADDDEITFDIDAAGTGAKGLKVVLYVVPT